MHGATGTITGDPINCGGISAAMFMVFGTFSATVTFRGTIDETNWFDIPAVNVSTGVVATTATAAGLYLVPFGCLQQIRADVTTRVSGTINVDVSLGEQPASSLYTVASIIPSGTQDVNVKNYNGSAVGPTNPVFEAPSVSVTSTGWTPFTKLTNLNATGNLIKSGAGKLGYVQLKNTSATDVYVMVYDAITKTGTAKLVFTVPPGQGWDLPISTEGFTFSTGIFIVIATATDGTGDPGTTINALTGGYI